MKRSAMHHLLLLGNAPKNPKRLTPCSNPYNHASTLKIPLTMLLTQVQSSAYRDVRSNYSDIDSTLRRALYASWYLRA